MDPEEASSIQDDELKRMKEKLSFHFMNPFEKWKYPRKRRFPWKLLVQLASIVLVTAQVGDRMWVVVWWWLWYVFVLHINKDSLTQSYFKYFRLYSYCRYIPPFLLPLPPSSSSLPQLIIFARTKFALTNFVQENQSTFTVLFVQQPEASDGDDPLPSPIRTLYTQQDLKNQIQFTIKQVK